MEMCYHYWDHIIEITNYLNKEVNCTKPFPSVSVPWSNHSWENVAVQTRRCLSLPNLSQTAPLMQSQFPADRERVPCLRFKVRNSILKKLILKKVINFSTFKNCNWAFFAG